MLVTVVLYVSIHSRGLNGFQSTYTLVFPLAREYFKSKIMSQQDPGYVATVCYKGCTYKKYTNLVKQDPGRARQTR